MQMHQLKIDHEAQNKRVDNPQLENGSAFSGLVSYSTL